MDETNNHDNDYINNMLLYKLDIKNIKLNILKIGG